jgi:hypothetical protein
MMIWIVTAFLMGVSLPVAFVIWALSDIEWVKNVHIMLGNEIDEASKKQSN